MLHLRNEKKIEERDSRYVGSSSVTLFLFHHCTFNDLSVFLKFYAYLPPSQAQFSQMRPVAMTPSVAPRMPMYPPGGPGIGQQIFYGQAPPAIIPSQVTSYFIFLMFSLVFI